MSACSKIVTLKLIQINNLYSNDFVSAFYTRGEKNPNLGRIHSLRNVSSLFLANTEELGPIACLLIKSKQNSNQFILNSARLR